MGDSKGRKVIFSCTVFYFIQLFCCVQSLILTELTSPYKVRLRNVVNGKYLSITHQGIIGLKTGSVTTQPYMEKHDQQWTLVWDPSLDNKYHDGYRLESRKEFLNQVTSYYPDGSTVALPNIWEVVELKSGANMFRNKRTRKCLQIVKPTSSKVTEKPCSVQNKLQHWTIKLLDINARIGERRYRVKNKIPLESDEEVENDSQDEEDDLSFENYMDE